MLEISDPERATWSLFDRMDSSLPPKSDGQKNLFWLYHNIYREDLSAVPALLPEIWVHWDPRTVRERGALALQNLRMDFLMLLPGNRRVVLEVDGMQHYTRKEGTLPDSKVRCHHGWRSGPEVPRIRSLPVRPR
ncbi:hypothetical protein [Streptomyces canus]|uniref:hypothetical protein n=1 Tax=Streptomyces canus TaxID=58343 RepID=UPI002E2DB4A0|nr:hypothetical protein [Streptomyces canus]